MNNSNYTLEGAVEYFEKYYDGDFNRYFAPSRKPDGKILISIAWGYSDSPTYRTSFLGRAAAAISPLLNERMSMSDDAEEDLQSELPDGTKEDDFLFAAFVGFHLMAQNALQSTLRHDKCFDQFVIDNAFPVIMERNRSHGMIDILKDVHLYPYSSQEKSLFYEAMVIIYPWLKERFMKDVCSWNNGELCSKNEFGRSNSYHIETELEKYYFLLKRELTEQKNLSGYGIDKKYIMDYFHKQYFADMEKYFKVDKSKSYPKIKYLEYDNNHRLQDGNPADSMNDNFVFSAIFLWMILVVKSVWHAGGTKIAETFHRSSGWPLIYSGPGGGFEISSMLMLKEAGIAPMPEESLYYLKTMDEVFYVMNEIFRQILNGRGDSIVNKTANAHLLSMITGHGHAKQLILKELEKEALLFREELFRNIQGLLEEYK